MEPARRREESSYDRRVSPRDQCAHARRVPSQRHACLPLAIVALTGCLGTACSFISSTLPPSAPDQRTRKAAANCGNIVYPVLDTASTIAGYTWVLYANRKEEESAPKTYNVGWDGTTTLESQGAPTADYGPVRILGYATMALFGASSLYGYYAALQCANMRHEIALRNRPTAAQPLAVLANPPQGIGGFTFDMTQLQAEQACAANRQAWHLDGTVALCSPNVESNDARPVRLDFQSGELHRMTVIRRASSGELAKTYDELYATLRTTYGPPQVERAALIGPCSGALAECMKNGEKPKGPMWTFPALTIELLPVWQGDQAVLEERYTHREDVGP
jgi:hypothetical protein